MQCAGPHPRTPRDADSHCGDGHRECDRTFRDRRNPQPNPGTTSRENQQASVPATDLTFAIPGYRRAAHITGMPEPILADFRARAVFGRRPSRHRPGTVFVVAVAAGKVGSCVEVGVAMNDQGRAVWIRNPDADDDLVAGFHSCLRAIGRTPTEWALNPPAAVIRRRRAPVTSR